MEAESTNRSTLKSPAIITCYVHKVSFDKTWLRSRNPEVVSIEGDLYKLTTAVLLNPKVIKQHDTLKTVREV